MNMVNSKFHKIKVNLTGVYFKVLVIQSDILNFAVNQTIYSTLHVFKVSCNSNTLY